MGIENFLVFGITALVFIITPGLDTVFVLNKSISQGRSSGAYAALGINAGVMVHTLFAALGLSFLIAQSPYAFLAIKYLGAAYIIYIGIRQLITIDKSGSMIYPNPISSVKRNFISGFWTNVLNPKVALFFLAFFPQFINPEQIKNPVPFLILGLSYALMGVVWYLCLSYFAGAFAQKSHNNSKVSIWINKTSGVLFILMGIAIAFQ